jgi:hypothetical protein
VPEGSGALHVTGEDLAPQPLERRTADHLRRVGGGRPVGREAQVGGAVAEEEGQRQDDPAADGPEAPEGARPAQPVQQVAHHGCQEGGAQPARRPEDPGPEAQAAPEPGAHRSHQRHHTDGLGQGQEQAEGEEEMPGLPHQSQQEHAAPVEQAPRQHEAPGPVPLAQPAADRGKERAHQVVHRHERADGADPPAEVAAGVPQRGHHDPGRLADGAADHLDHHQNADNDPAIMDGARAPAGLRGPLCLRVPRHRSHPEGLLGWRHGSGRGDCEVVAASAWLSPSITGVAPSSTVARTCGPARRVVPQSVRRYKVRLTARLSRSSTRRRARLRSACQCVRKLMLQSTSASVHVLLEILVGKAQE